MAGLLVWTYRRRRGNPSQLGDQISPIQTVGEVADSFGHLLWPDRYDAIA
jgi:hypothetical protein